MSEQHKPLRSRMVEEQYCVCECGKETTGTVNTSFTKKGVKMFVRIECPHCGKLRIWEGKDRDNLKKTFEGPWYNF